MLKLWKKHQKFLKGDAGFSLVELIIVIAIMAALIAILAPQYLKYVEKSRVSADKTQIDEIIKAVKVCAADPDTTAVPPLTISVATTDASKGAATISVSAGTDGSVGDFEDLLEDALGSLEAQFKSKDMLEAVTIQISVAEDTFAVSTSGIPSSLS